MANERREDREELRLDELRNPHASVSAIQRHEHGMPSYLIPEGVQEANRVDLKDGVDAARVGLQVLEHMVREELHDIDERVRRRHAMLHANTSAPCPQTHISFYLPESYFRASRQP